MKKILIPAFIVLMGAGAAFGTKLSSHALAIVDGYHIDAVSGNCITDNQKCNTTGTVDCTWDDDASVVLRNAPTPSNPTVCGTKLFKQ